MKDLFKPGALVRLWWVDSTHFPGWQLPEEEEMPDISCDCVGWVVDENENSVRITSVISRGLQNRWASEMMTIPKVAISYYEILVDEDPPRKWE